MKNDCIFATKNLSYPYEGCVTETMCLIKPEMKMVCDKETSKGCELYNAMKENKSLREFLKGWKDMI